MPKMVKEAIPNPSSLLRELKVCAIGRRQTPPRHRVPGAEGDGHPVAHGDDRRKPPNRFSRPEEAVKTPLMRMILAAGLVPGLVAFSHQPAPPLPFSPSANHHPISPVSYRI